MSWSNYLPSIVNTEPLTLHVVELWQAVEPQPPGDTRLAPPGTTWVCSACGKTARNRYDAPSPWDESCFMHSVLCHEPRGSDGRGA